MLGFLYIDGHVRAYHGKHTIPKAYVTRMHLAAPATTDYWVNDQRGDPLFVVTADANAAMTRMLTPVLREVRELLGPRRHSTVVFDRGGWSPKLFRDLLAMGFDILTYRKGRIRHIAEKRFTRHKAKLDGRPVEYLLNDQPVRFLKGKLRLRQVTRLTETGHQTPIVTSRWELRAIVVAHRMFERWRQENFFKYLREEYLTMLSRIIGSNPTIPPVPSPTRHEKPSRKKFMLRVFISGNYGKAMVQRQSITSMEVHPQTLILRLPKRKFAWILTKRQSASKNSRLDVTLFLLAWQLRMPKRARRW